VYDIGRVRQGHWTYASSQREFLEAVGRRLGIKELADWYRVRASDLSRHQRGGKGLLNQYGGSLRAALESAFPNFEWTPWQFRAVHRGFWMCLENRREYLQWLARELQVVQSVQWHNVRSEDVLRRRGGKRFLETGGGSIESALQSLLPTQSWFTCHHVLHDQLDVQRFVQWLRRALFIASDFEWKEVARDHVARLGGRVLLQPSADAAFAGLLPWSPSNAPGPQVPLKTQRLLFRMVRELVRSASEISTVVHFNWRLPSVVVVDKDVHTVPFSTSHSFHSRLSPLFLDVYVPGLCLAVEYHGEHHFRSSSMFGRPDRQRLLDQRKRMQCVSLGITLLELDFRWDLSLQRLLSAILATRPDLSHWQKQLITLVDLVNRKT